MSAEKERTEVSTDYSFRQVLDLLVDQKELSPQLLLAALSLTNLLGIVNYLNHVESPSTTATAARGADKQALTNTLLSLLAADGSGDKKEALLSGLMNTLGGGGGKKIDPAALLSLATSLAGQMDKTPATPAQYATDQPSTVKGQQAEVRELNARRG